MKLHFLGAAKIVTGSCYLLEVGGKKILVDCGMFQGVKEITRLNYRNFRFKPSEISYILLTHAHIDHSGLLPKLVKEGFRGKIISTSATKDLCNIMLVDSAYIHEKDTEHENKRRAREDLAPRKPLYTQKDAQETMHFFKTVEYNKFFKIDDLIEVCFRDAGHIVGSSIIEVYAERKKIVFSGDLGQRDTPIVRDPTPIHDADYVLVESTYGDRIHEDVSKRNERFLDFIKKTYNKGGRLLIPSFAVERTQELLYALKGFVKFGEMPHENVYLDSPLAIKATEIFKKHHEVFDVEARKKNHPFSFPGLIYSEKTEDSIRLNDLNEPCIIIAGSGMCNGGRIRHHLRHGISNEKNTVLFVGYQAEGTLGRVILEGAERIRMMGMELDVKAEIDKINGFSAHADSKDLVWWINGFRKKPKKVFIVHGEERSSLALKKNIKKLGFKAYIPYLGQVVEI